MPPTIVARSQPVGDPQVTDPRVIEVSHRGYLFEAKIGCLHLADGVIAPKTQTEAERPNAPAAVGAAVREAKERPPEEGRRRMW